MKKLNGWNIKVNTTKNNIICIRIIVNVGSFNEIENKTGLAHFVEHIFFKGTTDGMNAKDVAQEGSRLGDINAYTCEEVTTYFMNTTKENFGDTCKLLTDLLFKGKFSEIDLEKERKVILEEIQAQNDNNIYFGWAKAISNYQGTYPIIGLSDDVRNTTKQDLLNFRNKYYTPENILFSVTGDIGYSEVVDHLGCCLPSAPGTLAKNDGVTTTELKELNYDDMGIFHVSEQAFVAALWPVPKLADAAENRIADFTCHYLGGHMGSEMFETIREEHGLAYSTFTYNDLTRHNGFMLAGALVNKENIEKTKDLMFQIIDNLCKDGPDAKKFETTKQNRIFELTKALNSSSAIGGLDDNSFRRGTNCDTFEEIIVKIKAITKEDIKQFANEYFQGEHKFFTVSNIKKENSR